MFGLEHNEHPSGTEVLLERISDLARQAFLHLGSLGEAVDEASDLREADDIARWSAGS